MTYGSLGTAGPMGLISITGWTSSGSTILTTTSSSFLGDGNFAIFYLGIGLLTILEVFMID